MWLYDQAGPVRVFKTQKIVVTLHNMYIPWLIPNPKLCLVRFIYHRR